MNYSNDKLKTQGQDKTKTGQSQRDDQRKSSPQDGQRKVGQPHQGDPRKANPAKR